MEIRLEEVLEENQELKKQLAESETQLEEVRVQLTDTKRQYAAANTYIEDLRLQLDSKCKQLAESSIVSQPIVVDVAVQADIVPGQYSFYNLIIVVIEYHFIE
jgi:predicted nuclease with TOPRIM domain